MTATEPARTRLSRSWSALAQLHGTIEAQVERALERAHGLSLREYSLLDVLSRQHECQGEPLQMKQIADSVTLSQSATTRLVARLESRGLLLRRLCETDRRSIHTGVTASGLALLTEARPTHDAALRAAFDAAAVDPRLAPLVRSVEKLRVPA
jgi:DNA-binding MarR family transcriptional regulator